MKDFFKSKIATVLILAATLVLAGIAVFTALRLYQLRQEAVAPSAPTSIPKAAEPIKCAALTFTLGAVATETPGATATPGPTVTPGPAGTGTPGPTGTAQPLPETGASLPTIAAIAVGILLLIGSALLVF